MVAARLGMFQILRKKMIRRSQQMSNPLLDLRKEFMSHMVDDDSRCEVNFRAYLALCVKFGVDPYQGYLVAERQLLKKLHQVIGHFPSGGITFMVIVDGMPLDFGEGVEDDTDVFQGYRGKKIDIN
jgi:hypothetical protein